MTTSYRRPLEDWATPETIAEENPDLPAPTLRYLSRAGVREPCGFDRCVRFLSPRKMLISRSRFAEWIESRDQGGAEK